MAESQSLVFEFVRREYEGVNEICYFEDCKGATLGSGDHPSPPIPTDRQESRQGGLLREGEEQGQEREMEREREREKENQKDREKDKERGARKQPSFQDKIDDIERRLKTYGQLDKTSKISKKMGSDSKNQNGGNANLNFYDQGDFFINDEIEVQEMNDKGMTVLTAGLDDFCFYEGTPETLVKSEFYKIRMEILEDWQRENVESEEGENEVIEIESDENESEESNKKPRIVDTKGEGSVNKPKGVDVPKPMHEESLQNWMKYKHEKSQKQKQEKKTKKLQKKREKEAGNQEEEGGMKRIGEDIPKEGDGKEKKGAMKEMRKQSKDKEVQKVKKGNGERGDAKSSSSHLGLEEIVKIEKRVVARDEEEREENQVKKKVRVDGPAQGQEDGGQGGEARKNEKYIIKPIKNQYELSDQYRQFPTPQIRFQYIPDFSQIPPLYQSQFNQLKLDPQFHQSQFNQAQLDPQFHQNPLYLFKPPQPQPIYSLAFPPAGQRVEPKKVFPRPVQTPIPQQLQVIEIDEN